MGATAVTVAESTKVTGKALHIPGALTQRLHMVQLSRLLKYSAGKRNTLPGRCDFSLSPFAL
jgi:hypothetical protein